MKGHPPKLADKLFTAFCNKAFSEDLLGDLHEVYEYDCETKGQFRARARYWFQVFRLMSSYAIVKRKREGALSNYYPSQKLNIMLLNYIKVSFRNIAKNKTFAALNVFGLGLGMSIGLLALAFVVELNQLDHFHQDADKIYRITTQIKENGTKNDFASAPPALSYLADDQLTGLAQFVHINDRFYPTVKTTGQPIRLNGYFTQPSFLNMFDFPLASGSSDVLEKPGMVILTHETAEKLFGGKPAMGRQIETEHWGKLQVGAVLAPFPKKTHFSFDLLTGIAPDHALAESNAVNWTKFQGNYFYFKSDLEPEQVTAQINSMGRSGSPFFEAQEQEVSYSVQSLLDINPGREMKDKLGLVFDRLAVLGFFGMALLILVPACLNYGNMAVANALKRSKEIGIRKIMGSPNRHIIQQFLVETVITCLVAIILSVFIFSLIREQLLNMLVGGTTLTFSLSPALLLIFFLFAVLTGILTGLVPAIYFSRVTPIKAIRNTVNNQKISISGLRKALLVFQFVLSLVFMIGIAVLLKQHHNSLNYDQGFARENILVLPIQPENHKLMANAMSAVPAITDMSFTSGIPGTPIGKTTWFYNANGLDSINAGVIYADNQFLDQMNIEMQWGSGQLIDSRFEQVVVNEELMHRLINIGDSGADSLLAVMGDGKKVQIAGVVKNYNHEPLNMSIMPMVIRLNEAELSYGLLTLNSSDIVSTIEEIETRWEDLFPDAPFEATFLDHEIEKTYYFFLTGIRIFGFLALLAITISCLGLLGMVIFTTENRRKEVAIRKTLGANPISLLYALSGLFFKMWGIALIIAIPISYLYYDKIMLRVYNKFSGGVGFSEIALSSLLTLSLGLIAILIQSAKVMRTNPADSLRSE